MNYKLSRLALALTILGIIVFFACRKNDLSSSSSSAKNSDITDASVPMSVSLAKQYYKVLKHEQGTEVRLPHAAASQGSEVNSKHPLWQKAYTGETELNTFVEIPLFYNQRPSAIIKTGNEKQDMATIKQVLNTSFDRLIIYKNKKTGAVDQRILTYIPDATYLQSHAKEMSNNHLLHLEAFSGYLLFRKWDGTLLSGTKLENGKSIRRLRNIAKKINARSATTASTAKMVCTTYCTDTYTETCYHSESGEYSQDWCDWTYNGTYCWDECYDDGTGDGGGTGDPCIDYGICDPGGGGGNPDDNNDPDCVASIDQLDALVASATLDATLTKNPECHDETAFGRTCDYFWIAIKGIGWNIVSYEEGKHYKTPIINKKWKWQSVEHKSLNVIGTVVGGTITPTLVSTNSTMDTYHTIVEINYIVTYSVVCKDSPLSRNPVYKSAIALPSNW